MRFLQALALTTLLLVHSASAFEGNVFRGAALLREQRCTQCHPIQGEGGHTAPDLGIPTSRQFTPSTMASVMWNHAPQMWSAMDAQGVARPQLDERAAADLFAYFYAVRFFDRPGEAERGKRAFVVNRCAECHALGQEPGGPGKPVREWSSIGDPVVLVQQMWNHSSSMKEAFKDKKYQFVSLTGQDLNDLSVYLENLPGKRNKNFDHWLTDARAGEVVFKEKGCGRCHEGGMSPEYHMANQSLSDVAAAMWNHAPRMSHSPNITVGEMQELLSYIWEKQYMGAEGNAARGKTVFSKKHCVACHDAADSGAPHLGKGEKVYSSITMVSSLWKHGPAMLDQMRKRNMEWPQFTRTEMANLTAYLNSRP